MFARVYITVGIRNMRGVVKFLLAPVAMHELKVALSHNIQNFFSDAAKVALH
jgi:hypothetical protein